MEVGSIGVLSENLDGLKARARQIVRSSRDPTRSLQLLRAKVAAFLNTGGPRGRCKEASVARGTSSASAMGGIMSESSPARPAQVRDWGVMPAPFVAISMENQEIRRPEEVCRSQPTDKLRFLKVAVQKKEVEIVSVTCEPRTAAPARKVCADIMDTSMGVKGRMDEYLLALGVDSASDSEVFVSLKCLWVVKSAEIFQPADSRFFPPLLEAFTGSHYSEQNQMAQQMDEHFKKEVFEESLDKKSVVDTICRSAGSFQGHRRDQ